MHGTESDNNAAVMIALISAGLLYLAFTAAQNDPWVASSNATANAITQQVDELTRVKIHVATLALN